MSRSCLTDHDIQCLRSIFWLVLAQFIWCKVAAAFKVDARMAPLRSCQLATKRLLICNRNFEQWDLVIARQYTSAGFERAFTDQQQATERGAEHLVSLHFDLDRLWTQLGWNHHVGKHGSVLRVSRLISQYWAWTAHSASSNP